MTQAKHTKRPLKWHIWLRSLGPGIVTAAIVFGPSKVTITSKMGADHGYGLLWVVVVAISFMMVFTAMGSRIGWATQASLLTTIRHQYGKVAAGVIGVGICLVAVAFQAGNSTGIGLALSEVSGVSAATWITGFNILGILLLFFRNFYAILEKVMIALVVVMFFSFVSTLFFANPDLAGIAGGFSPSLPTGSLGLSIAFTASCFSIVGAFYQTYLVQERKRIQSGAEANGGNGAVGIVMLGVMSAVVMTCAAAVLHTQGIRINNAADMAKALQPLFGSYAAGVFLIGLFGASFSSLVGNATVGGVLLADGLGYDSRLDGVVVKWLIALVMMVGCVIAVTLEKPPLELIVFAQRITIFLVPFIGIVMYAISNNRAIMGGQANSITVRILGAVGLILLLILAAQSIDELFLSK